MIAYRGVITEPIFRAASRCRNRGWLFFGVLLPSILVVAGVIVFAMHVIPLQELSAAAAFALACPAMLVVGAGLCCWLIARSHARQVYEQSPYSRDPVDGMVDDQGVVVTNEMLETRLPWSDFTDRKGSSGLVVLLREDRDPVILARELFEDNAGWIEARRLATRQVSSSLSTGVIAGPLITLAALSVPVCGGVLGPVIGDRVEQIIARRNTAIAEREQRAANARRQRMANNPFPGMSVEQLSMQARMMGAQGDIELALRLYKTAIAMDPGSPAPYASRGAMYWQLGRYEQSISDLEQAVSKDPKHLEASNNLAWFLATCPNGDFRDGVNAIKHAITACDVSKQLSKQRRSMYIDTLAAACAEAGQFENAVRHQQQALDFAPENLKPQFRQRLELFKSGRPFREDPTVRRAPRPPARPPRPGDII